MNILFKRENVIKTNVNVTPIKEGQLLYKHII